ncbi:MAG: hypothetical protein MUF51_02055 [Vicinamibacteria bacterium]|nr:hypothetical protein [Vicinamibacteria bacterium]
MKRAGTLTLSEVLDDAFHLVPQVAAPWAGWMALLGLPLRFMQAHYIAELQELGTQAREYGIYLGGLALAWMLLIVPALVGRLMFVRACETRMSTLAAPGFKGARFTAAAFFCALYTTLLIESAFWLSCITWVLPPFFILLAGLSVATASLNERPSLTGPIAKIFDALRQGRIVFGLLFVIFVYMIYAGSILLCEPFWLGALSVQVHKARARRSGDDLRLWFERVTSVAEGA